MFQSSTNRGSPTWKGFASTNCWVSVSDDLSWNARCEHIYEQATKRLYRLRNLKKSGFLPYDLVSVYCSSIDVLEYASPLWAARPAYLGDH